MAILINCYPVCNLIAHVFAFLGLIIFLPSACMTITESNNVLFELYIQLIVILKALYMKLPTPAHVDRPDHFTLIIVNLSLKAFLSLSVIFNTVFSSLIITLCIILNTPFIFSSSLLRCLSCCNSSISLQGSLNLHPLYLIHRKARKRLPVTVQATNEHVSVIPRLQKHGDAQLPFQWRFAEMGFHWL